MGGSNSNMMNMPGMSSAPSATRRIAASLHANGAHRAVGAHAMMHLIPAWLGIAAAILFLAIAASHLRHLAHTGGQRRPWHACHVLMAVGMALMYAPAVIDPLRVPNGLWQSAFAAAGTLATFRAVGGSGRVPTLLWLLTSIDLAAMVYMHSAWMGVAPIAWLLIVYFVAQGGMWGADAYRVAHGRGLITWRQIVGSGRDLTLRARVARAVRADVAQPNLLTRELHIGAVMIGMALGMAYMLVAMSA